MQPWYSVLLQQSIANPLLIPQSLDLLLSPQRKPHPSVIQNNLSPVAWKVSDQISLVEEFQSKPPVLSKNLEENELGQITTRPGKSELADVINNRLIHLMQL